MQADRDQALVEIASLQETVTARGARIIQLEEQCRTETLHADASGTERDRHLEKPQKLETALGNARPPT